MPVRSFALMAPGRANQSAAPIAAAVTPTATSISTRTVFT